MSRGAGKARAAHFFLPWILTIFWALPATAHVVTLDDSGSQALETGVPLRWRSATPARAGTDNLMIGTTSVRVRINVAQWQHRVARIYLVLPAQRPGPLGLSWVTEGRLLGGAVQSGGRTLVFTGPLTTPFLEDLVKFQFSIDGSLVKRAFPVSYYFEMDGV